MIFDTFVTNISETEYLNNGRWEQSGYKQSFDARITDLQVPLTLIPTRGGAVESRPNWMAETWYNFEKKQRYVSHHSLLSLLLFIFYCRNVFSTVRRGDQATFKNTGRAKSYVYYPFPVFYDEIHYAGRKCRTHLTWSKVKSIVKKRYSEKKSTSIHSVREHGLI